MYTFYAFKQNLFSRRSKFQDDNVRKLAFAQKKKQIIIFALKPALICPGDLTSAMDPMHQNKMTRMKEFNIIIFKE
jgi:hypothetical protein